jgi:hypothetical protein
MRDEGMSPHNERHTVEVNSSSIREELFAPGLCEHAQPSGTRCASAKSDTNPGGSSLRPKPTPSFNRWWRLNCNRKCGQNRVTNMTKRKAADTHAGEGIGANTAEITRGNTAGRVGRGGAAFQLRQWEAVAASNRN